ncbi:TPA: 50S ribosomal protein L18 [Candidatus Poribacteria bacterium]|nr:50S ribosomal protein L18 [Candidatus Poribacteria bacterium]
MSSKLKKRESRLRRHKRIRKKIAGTDEKPRLSVFKSLRHIYAQVINDEQKVTIVSVCTLSPEIKEKIKYGGNIAASQLVGELIAKKAKALGIKNVVFDRGGYIYHGRVKALAEAARENGLQF